MFAMRMVARVGGGCGRSLRVPMAVARLVVASALLATSAAGATPAVPTSLEERQAQAESPADAADPATAPLDAELPPDPRVVTGRLDSGVTYYIRENGRPEGRAELRLVVNAGSVLEDDDQRGLAHLVEHMAFNGTERFEKQELVDFMESIGMRLGPDLNAYTSFDETVYMLQVPTDTPDHMATAFQILEDWAHAVAFEDEEIDKERGVVVEEWRGGRGAFQRVTDQVLPVLLAGSRYAERLPIGTRESIEGAPDEAVRRFYRDWYRPELMAVVAVGDFDADAIEALVRAHFEGVPPADEAAPRPTYEVPAHEGTRFAVAADDELPSTTVLVYHKTPVEETRTVGDYRRAIVEGLYHDMLNHRFQELTRRADPPFAFANSGTGRLVRTQAAYTLFAGVRPGGVERGLLALLTEAERVARHGFTETELERARARVLRGMEQAYDDRDNQESRRLAARYVRTYLTGEPVAAIEYRYGLHRRFVPEITLAEVEELGREWIRDDDRVVVVRAARQEGVEVPDAEALAAILVDVESAEIAAYEDTVLDVPLLATVPEPAEIVDTRVVEAVGITEWTLANGATVVLKPTDYKDDEVVFRAISPGGVSLASDEEWVYAVSASNVVNTGGVGELSAVDLQKVLAGKAANVTPFISRYQEGLRGGASPKDLETLFQLAYLRFTAPRADPEAFEAYRTNTKAFLANQLNFPQFAFSRAVQRILTQDHPRARQLTPELVDEFDLARSLAFYRERFADASDFTFILVGKIDVEAIRPLVQRYLGVLPASGREESWRDVGIRPPDGVVTEEVHKGREPQSSTRLVFTGPFEFERQRRTEIRAMASVLQTRLRDLLREELSGTYGVGVSASHDWRPEESYSVSISFGSAPERVDELVDRVFGEIDSLKGDGPTEQETADVRAQLLRAYETDAQENRWWAAQLAHKYDRGEDPSDLVDYPDSVEALTPAMIREAARRYLDTDSYVRVTLYPEIAEPEPSRRGR